MFVNNIGTVPGGSVPQSFTQSYISKRSTYQSTSKSPEQEPSRGLNYYADFSGCGHWRMIWPETILNAYQKCIVHGSTSMLLDPKVYEHINTVRIQRQANPTQLDFVKHLKRIQNKNHFNLIYEIDDVLFHEDIPDYNKFKRAFISDDIRKSSQEIIELCDEVTVTCQYMKEYFQSKTSNKNVTVIPNYIPRFWMDRYYDEKQKTVEYDKNVKKRRRPRVLWSGSGAHFDQNGVGYDDFTHVIEVVIKTLKKYQWVFMGAIPNALVQYVKSGDIEFHKWVPILDYPHAVHKLNAQVAVAPLHNNPFNNSKSDLKYIEAGALGTPVICQNMHTYKNTPLVFNTGAELVDQIDHVIQSKNNYMKWVRKFRSGVESRWLEDNVNVYNELYSLPYGHPKRQQISNLNCI